MPATEPRLIGINGCEEIAHQRVRRTIGAEVKTESHVNPGTAATHASQREMPAGFDPASPRKPGSFGLVGMRERAYLLGGTYAVESGPETGTEIVIRLRLPGRPVLAEGDPVTELGVP